MPAADVGETGLAVPQPRPSHPAPWLQRRAISPPGLLDQALLENELLGGAGTAMRAMIAATHADRRLVPQQRACISDPSAYPIQVRNAQSAATVTAPQGSTPARSD